VATPVFPPREPLPVTRVVALWVFCTVRVLLVAVGERTDEEELPVESSERTTSDDNDGADERFQRTEDRTAERFLELESELAAGSGATLPDGTVRPARLVDAELVSAADVPDGYPLAPGEGRALGVTLELQSGRRVPAYLDWPEDGDPTAESALGRLLAGLDVAPAQLAALYGRRLLVEVVDGRYTPYLPDEPPRGTGRDVYGVVTAAVASVATLLGLGLGLGSGTLLFVLFLLLTVFVLPLFTYRDAWYLRTHSDWEGGPVFWATLSMIPGLNLASTVLYLRARDRATVL
jgi:hypothetical protein